MGVSKFRDGRVHFKNSRVKELNIVHGSNPFLKRVTFVLPELTLVLLSLDMPDVSNRVDPDRLARSVCTVCH